jgi:hypothetical protein
MPKLDFYYLSVLQLKIEELESLSEEEQKKKIKKAYYRLSGERHPDKGGSSEAFATLNAAYRTLISSGLENVHEINQFFSYQEIKIPDTAFDLLLEENIIHAYEELLRSFSQLPDQERKQFVEEHTDFLNLAQNLEKRIPELNANRAEYLFMQEKEPPLKTYKREWRTLMLTLYGEEYLDDFQYRQAIATGELSSLLAVRKLLSPFKLLAALANSIILALSIGATFLLKKLTLPLIKDLIILMHSRERVNKRGIALWLLKTVSLAVLMVAPFIFFPASATALLSLPFLGSLLTLLACPVNRIVRPLTQFAKLSPYLVDVALIILLGACAFVFVNFFPIAALTSLLTVATLALSLYALYGTAKLIKKLYDISPALAFFQLTLIIVSIVASIANYAIPSLAVPPLVAFFGNLVGAGIVYQTNQTVDNLAKEIADKVETLPLPEESIPEPQRKAVLQMVKTGHYSSKFFNTRKEAPFITEKDRTIGQKVASFFGAGERSSTTAPREQRNEYSAEPLLIEYILR